MGAYAALSSLMKTLEQLRQPNPRLVCGSEQLVESTYQNLCALQAFLDDATKEANDLETLEILEKRIRSVAYKLEDAVDSSLRSLVVADRKYNRQRAQKYCFHCFSKNQRAPRSFNEEMVKVEREVDSLRKEVMQIEFNCHHQEAAKPSSSSSIRTGIDDLQNVVVGMNDDFNIILDRLTSQTNELLVIPIVGMGGIGKTTLAKKAFLDFSIRHRFDKHAWVTISETYDERQILLQLVSSISKECNKEIMSNDQLAEIVYRGLKFRRYLIVIDDLWSSDPWDQMRRSFPDDNNKSRILLTTRLNHVANYARCPDFSPHSMSFLSLDDSWNLFTGRLFQNDPCPPQLEKIGKHIIQHCRGLPLSIVVIAGLLGKMEATSDNWKRVEENLSSFLGAVSEQCEAILSFSYTYLPQYLKACFLYIGSFPEDMEINVSKLIGLWIAEEFIKARSYTRLEAVAKEYLEELISRSLILVGRRRSDGRIKTCKIHDVLRQLCIKKAKSENVVHMNKNKYSIFSRDRKNKQRVMVLIIRYEPHVSEDVTTRSLVSTTDIYESSIKRLCSSISCFKLLKVLDVLSIKNDFSSIICGLVHLRYVAANIVEIPSLAKLWNIQTIIFVRLGYIRRLELPAEIWTMSDLRHLEVENSIYMPNPIEAEPSLLINLQKLHLYVNNSTLVVEILRRTPNLNKLRIYFNYRAIDWSGFLDCLGLLQGLETLQISFLADSSILSNWDIFLPNLKQLELTFANFPWEDMVVLAKLPNLELLKTYHAFKGTDWRLNEDVVFERLKYLRIEDVPLEKWEASSDNFPMLAQLLLRELCYLEEIPHNIGEITALKLIQVEYCSLGAACSAMQIQEEQESWGNYDLQVQIKNRYVKIFFA